MAKSGFEYVIFGVVCFLDRYREMWATAANKDR